MRRQMLLATAVLVALTFVPRFAHAQMGGRGGDDQQQQDDEAKSKKRKEDWGDNQAPLPQLKNAGPCPYVKTLYDAGRYVEFTQGKEASADVGFTGEIQGISAGCQYKDAEPIQVTMQVLFEMGRGPQAQGREKTYHYWVAVTDRNRAVLGKQEFDLPVTFPQGKDRVYVTENIDKIVIPRAAATTSGANFEVLIGFDVTPQMADFNRLGKRFRLDVGETASNAEAPKRKP